MGNSKRQLLPTVLTLTLLFGMIQLSQQLKQKQQRFLAQSKATSVSYTELTEQSLSQATNCYSIFLSTMSDYSQADRDTLIETMATSICPDSLTTVSIQYKPYLCAFSSIFTYFYLQSTLPDSSTIANYASSYCSNIEEVEDAKLTLFANLVTISLDDETTFKTSCETYLEDYESYNYWFDPVVPIDSITLDNLCGNIYTLYYELTYTAGYPGTDYFAYYIAKTSQLIILEYLNYIKLMLYDECTATTVVELGAIQYCEDYIEPEITMWQLTSDVCVDSTFDDSVTSCGEILAAVFDNINEQVIDYSESMFNTVSTTLTNELMSST